MKNEKNLLKLGFSILLCFVITGCVTNPYTRADYNAGFKPLSTEASYIIGVIPGLTQFINGEFWEGIIYAGGGLALPIYRFALPDSFYAKSSDGMDVFTSRMIVVGTTYLLFAGIGYYDGVISTQERNKQLESYKMEDLLNKQIAINQLEKEKQEKTAKLEKEYTERLNKEIQDKQYNIFREAAKTKVPFIISYLEKESVSFYKIEIENITTKDIAYIYFEASSGNDGDNAIKVQQDFVNLLKPNDKSQLYIEYYKDDTMNMFNYKINYLKVVFNDKTILELENIKFDEIMFNAKEGIK